MKYVIDSSVSFKWLVSEVDTDKLVKNLQPTYPFIVKISSLV